MYASRWNRWGPRHRVVAKRTLVGKGGEGPRGRLKVAAGPHARLSHAYTHAYPRIAHAHGVHTSLQHGRVHERARARCSIGRERVCVRVRVSNVRARPPAS